eukprot:GHVS01005387.1.p1 GENE.GHVS01005387.1~~GHVS01005387.1.p1  ORF type:complete len:217 (+),score=23.90 GHVS01005387.1:384-1034(+)
MTTRSVVHVVVSLLLLQCLSSSHYLYFLPSALCAVCSTSKPLLQPTSPSSTPVTTKSYSLTTAPSVGHAQLYADHALECYRQGNESPEFPNGHCVMIGAYEQFSPSLQNLFEQLRSEPVVDGLHHLKSLQTFLIQIKTKWNHVDNDDKVQILQHPQTDSDGSPAPDDNIVTEGEAVVVSRLVELDPIVLDIFRVVEIILTNPLVVAFDNDSRNAAL